MATLQTVTKNSDDSISVDMQCSAWEVSQAAWFAYDNSNCHIQFRYKWLNNNTLRIYYVNFNAAGTRSNGDWATYCTRNITLSIKTGIKKYQDLDFNNLTDLIQLFEYHDTRGSQGWYGNGSGIQTPSTILFSIPTSQTELAVNYSNPVVIPSSEYSESWGTGNRYMLQGLEFYATNIDKYFTPVLQGDPNFNGGVWGKGYLKENDRLKNVTNINSNNPTNYYTIFKDFSVKKDKNFLLQFIWEGGLSGGYSGNYGFSECYENETKQNAHGAWNGESGTAIEGYTALNNKIIYVEPPELINHNFVYIYDDGTKTWKAYTPYIYKNDADKWVEHVPYIYNGTSWVEY